MTIALTAFKEKIRRKELYIVTIIGILIVILFGTGSGQLSLNGVAITDYEMLAPILLIVVNAACCILSVIMSLGTIPNEYERRTSHLIWIRKISQSRYHGELAVANILSGLASEAILFAAMVIFMVIQDRATDLWKLIPAFVIIAINVSMVCLMTSAFSVVLPRFATGAIASAITLVGICHSLLELLKDILGGFAGTFIKMVLGIIPDLHGVQAQAANILCGGEIDIHLILKGLLAVYVFAVLLMIFKRKEA